MNDGADSLRAHLRNKHGVDTRGLPAIVVARRVATILGLRLDGMIDSSAITMTTLRADAEWSEDDHPRGDDGKFAAAGAATGAAEGATREAMGQPRGGSYQAHEKAAQAHEAAAEVHERSGAQEIADSHWTAAGYHKDAATEDRKAARSGAYVPNEYPRRGASREARNASRLAKAYGMPTHGVDGIQPKSGGDRPQAVVTPRPSGVDSIQPKSGGPTPGHSSGHAEKAAASAAQARAAAAGTTASARSSARKAEEHAALARVAADYGDHASAAQHASEAARHAADVSRKVGALSPTSAKTLGGAVDTQVSQHPSTLAQFHKDPKGTVHDVIVGRSLADSESVRSQVHGRLAELHQAGVDSIKPGKSSDAQGKALTASAQAQAVSDRAKLEGSPTRPARTAGVDAIQPKSAAPEHPAITQARQSSEAAARASTVASQINTPAAHLNAERMHGEAIVANRAVGYGANVRAHAMTMDQHGAAAIRLQAQGAGITVAQHADNLSRAATTQTRTASSPSQHLEAQAAHDQASRAYQVLGNSSMANTHRMVADDHQIAGSPDRSDRTAAGNASWKQSAANSAREASKILESRRKS